MDYFIRKSSIFMLTALMILVGCCPPFCPNGGEPRPILSRTLLMPGVFGGVNDVIRFDSKLVAVGKTFDPANPYNTDRAAVWTSVDNGKTWIPVPYDAAVFGQSPSRMNAVAVGGPGVVAVGFKYGGGAVWTSADGINWNLICLGDALNDVITTSSGLYAVGHMGHAASIWKSSDGQTWSHVFTQSKEHPGSSPPINIRLSNMYAVAVGTPGYTPEFVAVGYYGWAGWDYSQSPVDAASHRDAAIWTSTDGTNWTMLQPYEEMGDGHRKISNLT